MPQVLWQAGRLTSVRSRVMHRRIIALDPNAAREWGAGSRENHACGTAKHMTSAI